MKRRNELDRITKRLIEIANMHRGNLADIRFTERSYSAISDVLCHLTSMDGRISIRGSLKHLHRILDKNGWTNATADDPNASWWIQPVAME